MERGERGGAGARANRGRIARARESAAVPGTVAEVAIDTSAGDDVAGARIERAGREGPRRGGVSAREKEAGGRAARSRSPRARAKVDKLRAGANVLVQLRPGARALTQARLPNEYIRAPCRRPPPVRMAPDARASGASAPFEPYPVPQRTLDLKREHAYFRVRLCVPPRPRPQNLPRATPRAPRASPSASP